MDTPPKKVQSPWLTKGGGYLLNGSTQRQPANGVVPQPITSSVSWSNVSKQRMRDYYIRSSDFVDGSFTDDTNMVVYSYMDSIVKNANVLVGSNGDNINFSLFDGYKTIGFVNEGNNCYQNCVFQVLLHSPQLFQFLHGLFVLVGNKDNPHTPLLTLLIRVISIMKQISTDSSISLPTCLHLHELRELIAIRNCMFAEEQSDVHEFFLYIISELTKECNFFSSLERTTIPVVSSEETWEEIGSKGRRIVINDAKMDEGIVNSIFETQLRKLNSSYSKKQYVEQQSFATLSLPISNKTISSVDEALSIFLAGGYDEKKESYRIEKSPTCLVLHLMRFSYDRKNQCPFKINKHIDFTSSLSLLKYNLFETALFSEYTLYGMISHKGNAASNGHYICFCKTKEHVWMCCDDERVREVSFTEVLHSQPYMLFYQAVQ